MKRTTRRQAQAIALREQGKTYRQIGKEMGISHPTVIELIQNGRKGSLPVGVGTAPPLPEGMEASSHTVLYDKNGEVLLHWRKAIPELGFMESYCDRLIERVKGKGRTPKYSSRKSDRDDLLMEIAIPDAHLGLLAWGAETHDKDYDVKIAKDRIVESVWEICSRSRASRIVLAFLGDNFHTDNRSGTTEKSNNHLDTDGRFDRMLEYGEAAIIDSIELASKAAPQVEVLIIPGNHDWHLSRCMRRIVNAYYKDCPNVSVVLDPNPRYAIQWGEVMVAWAHGDCVRPNDWAKVVPSQFPLIWGRTKRRYLHLGHIHRKRVFAPVTVDGQQGITVEYLQSLCPADSYATDMGYVGGMKGAEGFLYTKEGLDTRWTLER